MRDHSGICIMAGGVQGIANELYDAAIISPSEKVVVSRQSLLDIIIYLESLQDVVDAESAVSWDMGYEEGCKEADKAFDYVLEKDIRHKGEFSYQFRKELEDLQASRRV